ncbi:MAG: substrate-binding domain-containing protein [Terriglobia bacterium]|jgi:LacI family transcriptional regulator
MRKIGVRQIAKLADVSPGTVDRALHGRKGITESTRKRILAIAESAGYEPDLAARALSTGRVPIRIGVCIPQEIQYYFDQLLNGILTEAKRLERLGVQVVCRPTARLGVEEVERVSELLREEVQAILIVPGDPAKLTPILDVAEKKNVRVLCVDTDAPASRRSTVVCVNAEVAGKLAAELMSSFVASQAQVAIITGMLKTEDHAKKTRGFCELYPQLSNGGSVVEVIEAHEEEEEAFQKCRELLERCSSLAGLYVNTVNCLPVCRAICALGLSGKIALITTDLFRGMIPYFEKGTIRASIHGRPFMQGELAMRIVIDHIVNHRPLPPFYYVSPHIVLRSNLYVFRETRYPDGVSRSTVASVDHPAAWKGAPEQTVHNRQDEVD